MGKRMSGKKIVSLPVDNGLYDALSAYASRQGEGVADLVLRLLADSMDGWCDYCDSLRLLESDEDRRVCVANKD